MLKEEADIIKRTRLLEDIGRRMRKVREILSYSQDKFAGILNVSKPAYVRYEYGQRFPPLNVIRFLYKKYRINNNWLLTGEGKMFRAKVKETEEEEKLPWEHLFAGKKKYAELVELMKVPAIEEFILAKMMELKYLFKDEIAEFKAAQQALTEKKSRRARRQYIRQPKTPPGKKTG